MALERWSPVLLQEAEAEAVRFRKAQQSRRGAQLMLQTIKVLALVWLTDADAVSPFSFSLFTGR